MNVMYYNCNCILKDLFGTFQADQNLIKSKEVFRLLFMSWTLYLKKLAFFMWRIILERHFFKVYIHSFPNGNTGHIVRRRE